MRFYFNENKDGDARVKAHFAFLPIRIHDELRWLEFVRYEERWYDEQDGWVKTSFHST